MGDRFGRDSGLGSAPENELDGGLLGFGVLFVIRNQAQKEVGDVGQNGGAARGDAILRQENIEFGERVADPFDRLQGFTNVAEPRHELRGKIGGTRGLLHRSMARAKTRSGTGASGAAAASGGREVATLVRTESFDGFA